MQRSSAPQDDDALWIRAILQTTFKEGLALLWRALQYSRSLQTDAWDFAVERDDLSNTGLSTVDLRWLIACGYVEVRQENRRANECKRSFGVSFLAKRATFTLTEAGASVARRMLSEPALPPLSEPDKHKPIKHVHIKSVNGHLPQHKPCWDADRKELRLNGDLVKQFRWSALNQETVLMAFQEDGWPARIDDPLPPRPNQEPKRRLHDTIKCLNRNHKTRVIHFSGDGSGEGVLWCFVDASMMDG